MKTKPVAAIDIGTKKIVVLVGERAENNKINITAIDKSTSYGVDRGIVKNVEKAAQAIRESLQKINFDSQEINEVWVGIAGQHVRSIKTQASIKFSDKKHKIIYDDIEELVQESFKTAIDHNETIVNVTPQTFNTEHKKKIFSPLKEESSFLEGNFLLTIAQESSLENISNSLMINNLKPKELILESIASAQSVLTEEQVQKGVILIDIGGGTSDIAIFHKGSIIHSAVIPFGGEVVTSDIMKAFDLDYQYAEALKTQYGSVLYDKDSKDVISLKNKMGEKINIKLKDLNFVITARIEEIIDLIKFQIEISGQAKQLEKGIVLTGGGALLKNIKQLYQFHFSQQNVEIGIPKTEFINPTSKENLNQPIFSTATGLLITGIKYEESLIKRKEIEEEIKAEISKEEEEKQKAKPKKGKPFDSLRDRFREIFNEEDKELK